MWLGLWPLSFPKCKGTVTGRPTGGLRYVYIQYSDSMDFLNVLLLTIHRLPQGGQ